jgi:DNA-binding LacI/PurR family transcriptional regulator
MLLKPKTLKRHRLAAHLRDLIGTLAPGDRLPSVTELEAHFNVATSTVEAAMESLRSEGLVVRRRGSGTYVAETPTPPTNAETLSRSGFIALMTSPASPHSVFMDMLRVVENELRRLEYSTLLLIETNPQAALCQALEHWEQGRIQGFIHAGSADFKAPPLVPGVVIGETPQAGQVGQVVVDNYACGRRAAQYLWELGHRRICFVGATYANQIGPPRLAGMSSFLNEQKNAPLPCALVLEWGSEETLDPQAVQQFESLLASPNPPTAFFAYNDAMAVSVIRILNALGRRVPEEISVVGFDDMQILSANFQPPLTTLRMPSESLGQKAVAMLHARLTSVSGAVEQIRLPAELIVRGSAAPPKHVCDS